MKATIRKITGFEDAIAGMFLSKRTWNPELDKEIKTVCRRVLDTEGAISHDCDKKNLEQFNKWLKMTLETGKKHITINRFINISIMTEEIHRGAQDDIDSHARRFDNRIIRSSTRLATFNQDEFSDYYKDKVITTDAVLKFLEIEIPNTIVINDERYVKSPNGYVKEEYKDNKDVKRGLYMLGIPSNFISQINLCEWGHVFKQRNKDGGANPEVKEWAEMVTQGITNLHSQITREYILSIEN